VGLLMSSGTVSPRSGAGPWGRGTALAGSRVVPPEPGRLPAIAWGSLHTLASIPTVSALLPARDAEATVDAAVESVLAQTFADLELLAVDDGSTDGTAEKLVAWARRDARVRVLRTGGVGLVGALELGRREARGRYLMRMDADDESLPGRLEASVAALEADASLAGVGTAVEIFRDDRPVSPNLQAYGRWLSGLTTAERLYQERLIESPLCHPSVTLRSQALAQVGGWRDEDVPEDWELWLRLLQHGHRLRALPQVLHRWRDHDRRVTRTDARYGFDRHHRLKARHLAACFPDATFWVWGAGEVGRALSRALSAEGRAVARFVELHPRKVGQRSHQAEVIHPDALGGPEPKVQLLAAVGARGARAEIREALAARGWVEGRDFTCVA